MDKCFSFIKISSLLLSLLFGNFLMTIAGGVHDTTLNTGIMSGPISRLRLRQSDAGCRVHYWDYADPMSRQTPAGLSLVTFMHRIIDGTLVLLAINSFFIEISIVCLLIVMLRRGPLDPCPWSVESLAMGEYFSNPYLYSMAIFKMRRKWLVTNLFYGRIH